VANDIIGTLDANQRINVGISGLAKRVRNRLDEIKTAILKGGETALTDAAFKGETNPRVNPSTNAQDEDEPEPEAGSSPVEASQASQLRSKDSNEATGHEGGKG
jgi:hypothetical protein